MIGCGCDSGSRVKGKSKTCQCVVEAVIGHRGMPYAGRSGAKDGFSVLAQQRPPYLTSRNTCDFFTLGFQVSEAQEKLCCDQMNPMHSTIMFGESVRGRSGGITTRENGLTRLPNRADCTVVLPKQRCG